jgi:DNA-binding NarL/FixJ family response regulator
MTKVFLAEDSPLVLARIKGLLASAPEAEIVGEADSAAGAIEGILQSRPDVVLLDLNLAPGSGFDVLRSLHPRLPGVDFYMLSNFAAAPYRELAARLGAKDYFDKSSDFKRVLDLLAGRAASVTH